MPVQFKDYYAVLGVPRDAGAADIKKAFRKLAHQYHPDVAKDRSTAEEKFKELNEANEVLSDPEKRRRYDELGARWQQPGREQSWSQEDMGGGYGEASEFRFEGTGFSDFFEQFFGSRMRGAGFGGARGRSAERGQDIEGDILVTLDELVRGSTRVITLERTDPRTGLAATETLRVKIPAGVHEGQLIRLAGKGHEGSGGAGDLFLRAKIAAHPDFRVQGPDLHYELDLAPWEAVLGATVRIPTLEGAVSLKVPAGTAAGQALRLRGKGLPAADGTRGHLYASVSIQVPAHVTPEQKALWEQLAKSAAFDPRAPHAG